MSPMSLIWLIGILCLASCYREPELHLPHRQRGDISLPTVELRLDIYWDYEIGIGINYDWRSEWHYGWDDEDRRLFGELGYSEPTTFHLRSYYTGSTAFGPRLRREKAYVEGRIFRRNYDWGFWDVMAWNQVETLDGVQSLHFSETDNLDEEITAYTNPSMNSARYHAPRYQNSFYEPEQLFSAISQGIEIREDLHGFEFDEESNVWVLKLPLLLEPITYIYLPQVILHHNRTAAGGPIITGITGIANLSGMARSTSLNTGIAGKDPVAVYCNMRMKRDIDKQGEQVDIAGGRLLTFGICGQNGNRVSRADDSNDPNHHYLDLTMQFYNGTDSTFVFDVTDQVRRRYKGGVITVELDMDHVPVPQRKGGSGFNAVVKDYEDGGTWEIDM